MEMGPVIRVTGMSLSLSRSVRNPLAYVNGSVHRKALVDVSEKR